MKSVFADLTGFNLLWRVNKREKKKLLKVKEFFCENPELISPKQFFKENKAIDIQCFLCGNGA